MQKNIAALGMISEYGPSPSSTFGLYNKEKVHGPEKVYDQMKATLQAMLEAEKKESYNQCYLFEESNAADDALHDVTIQDKVLTLPTSYARFEITLGYFKSESDAKMFFKVFYDKEYFQDFLEYGECDPEYGLEHAYLHARPGRMYIESEKELHDLLAPIFGDEATKHVTYAVERSLDDTQRRHDERTRYEEGVMFDALRAVTTTERRNARTRFEDLWKKHMAVDSKDINGVDVTTMTVTTMPKEKKTARSFPLNYKGNSTAVQLGSTADDRGDAHSPQRARALEPPPVPKPAEPADPSRVHESHVGSPSPS